MTQPSVPLSRSSSILLILLGNLVTPMFVPVTGGDVNLARMAALATINDFGAASKADLIAIAQIIVFGLASVAAAVASVSEDMPVTVMLNLQRSALGFERASDRKRRTLGKYGRGFVAEAEADALAAAQSAAAAAAAVATSQSRATAEIAVSPEVSRAAVAATALDDPRAATELESYAALEPAGRDAQAGLDLSGAPAPKDIPDEPPLFPNDDAARMLEAEAEARLRHPATGPALPLPPDLVSRRTQPAGYLTDVMGPMPSAAGGDMRALKLPGFHGEERRPHSVRQAALSTTAATRLTDPDIPFKR